MPDNIIDPIDNIQIVVDEFLRKVNEEISRLDGLNDREIKIGLELARTMFNDVIGQNNAIEGTE